MANGRYRVIIDGEEIVKSMKGINLFSSTGGTGGTYHEAIVGDESGGSERQLPMRSKEDSIVWASEIIRSIDPRDPREPMKKLVLVVCDISGSMREGPRIEIMKSLIQKTCDSHCGEVRVAFFGPSRERDYVGRESLPCDEALEFLSGDVFRSATSFSPYGVQAIEGGARDAFLLIIITDGMVHDKEEMINAIGNSKINHHLMFIVGDQSRRVIDLIKDPLRRSIAASSTPKNLIGVIHMPTCADDANEIIIEATSEKVPEWKERGLSPLCIGDLRVHPWRLSEVKRALSTLVTAGIVQERHVARASKFLLNTLKQMNDPILMRQLMEVPWFNTVHTALLDCGLPLHPNAFRLLCKTNEGLSSLRRAAEQSRIFDKENGRLVALLPTSWSIQLVTRGGGGVSTPQRGDVMKAIASGDPSMLFNIVKASGDLLLSKRGSAVESVDGTAAVIRLLFSHLGLILNESHAIMLSAGMLNGDLPCGPRLDPIIDALKEFVGARGASILENIYGQDPIDPRGFSRHVLRCSATMLRYGAAVSGFDSARTRSARACRLDNALRIKEILSKETYPSPIPRMSVQHLGLYYFLVFLPPYQNDPFPSFPSLAIVSLNPRGYVSGFYVEQPDKLLFEDKWTTPLAKFIAMDATVIGHGPKRDFDHIRDSPRELLLLKKNMEALWIKAGGSRTPEMIIKKWRFGGATRGHRPKTGTPNGFDALPDVTRVAKDFIVAMGGQLGIPQLEFQRPYTREDITKAISDTLNVPIAFLECPAGHAGRHSTLLRCFAMGEEPYWDVEAAHIAAKEASLAHVTKLIEQGLCDDDTVSHIEQLAGMVKGILESMYEDRICGRITAECCVCFTVQCDEAREAFVTPPCPNSDRHHICESCKDHWSARCVAIGMPFTCPICRSVRSVRT